MNYLIYGSKDFAFLLKDMLDFHDKKFIGFIDDYNSGNDIVGSFDYVINKYAIGDVSIVLGIGYNNLHARWNIFNKIKRAGYTIATLIHKNAYVRHKDNIGEGSIIMANATVDCNAIIREGVVVWPGVVVNHDSVISRNTFLSPSAVICGFVTVGDDCFIGAGAVITDHCYVPAKSFIKANTIFKK
ncbi:MAG: hypothetical protein ACOYLR_06880 [Chlorobium sp.]